MELQITRLKEVNQAQKNKWCMISLICELLKKISKLNLSQMPVVHAYNTSYLGGWDQEDRHSRPVHTNSS
jgi:hypothetical protein